jgi:hypothetical protein
MPVDFRDAHDRHWDDAETLFGATRLPNADQLYGISAECGLKAMMIVFGMPVRPDGDPTKQTDRVHVDKVWQRYETYSQSYSGQQYTLPTGDPFDNWAASQRYFHSADIGAPIVGAHRIAAQQVRDLLHRAKADGIL